MAKMIQVPAEDWELSQKTITRQNELLSKAQHNGHAGDPNAAFAGLANYGVAPAFLKGGLWGSNRPYRLYKALGFAKGKFSEAEAKVELDANKKIQKAMAETGAGFSQFGGDSLIYPFDLNLLPNVLQESKEFMEAWHTIKAGREGADPYEVRRAMGLSTPPGTVLRESPMSAFTDNIGGTLVAPPVMGEVAPLMRPVPAVQRAGARVVPLPPNGRFVAPTIISPTTGYWMTENASITESRIGTGQWALQAKKLAALARVPNELYRFAAPAMDAALQGDMTRTIELGLDYAALYGAGGGDEPKGLDKYTETNQVIVYTPVVTGANGDTLKPEDGYFMAGRIEERNFQFEGWIFRTQLFAKISGFRADAVAIGDAAGQFVQSQMRNFGDGVGPAWDGYPATLSNVIVNTETKGTATNLSQVWGGQWSKLTVGMYGAIEYAMSNQAGTAFAQDQTMIRGILFADVGTPYPSCFIYATDLVTYA